MAAGPRWLSFADVDADVDAGFEPLPVAAGDFLSALVRPTLQRLDTLPSESLAHLSLDDVRGRLATWLAGFAGDVLAWWAAEKVWIAAPRATVCRRLADLWTPSMDDLVVLDSVSTRFVVLDREQVVTWGRVC